MAPVVMTSSIGTIRLSRVWPLADGCIAKAPLTLRQQLGADMFTRRAVLHRRLIEALGERPGSMQQYGDQRIGVFQQGRAGAHQPLGEGAGDVGLNLSV